ncbi:MAG TPA: four helix bundle protein [Candidatus Thermoplasmatota archaeon]|nr:four helix bundle protein [Candidatus Thermoplasmatota archaeon]
MWQHTKLDAYRKAVRVAIELEAISAKIPHHRLDLRDQLRRASSSIPFNIAEGANEFSPAEKARIHRIARRSAGESAAILDLVEGLFGGSADIESARKLLNDVAAMLTKLIAAMPVKRG